MKDKLAPTLVAWILFDTTTNKKYIKMNPADGSLAIFDTEEAAMAAKKLHSGTDYKRCEYYSAPQPEPMIRKLGIMGAAFDQTTVRRAYTYSDQPNNTTAWKLGRVACKERSGGDFIDYGLQLLQHLQDEGFGVFEIDESDPTPQPAPGVAKLVEALEQGFPLLSDEGLDEVEHHCEWVIQRERKRVHSILAAHHKKEDKP